MTNFYFMRRRLEREVQDMKLTEEEKEILYVYGCPSYENTIKRLGMACVLMVDPMTKANTNNLRYKIAGLNSHKDYYNVYVAVRKELGELIYKGNAA